MELKPVKKTLFVSASTNVGKLGSAIAHSVYSETPIELRAIGAGAVSQAVKAIAVARGYVAPHAVDLLIRVGFTDVKLPDKVSTAMVFEIVTDR